MRLVLHIGAAKCGSSAIQRFLANNANVLRTNGILVPGTKCDSESEITGDQIWFFEDVNKRNKAEEIVYRRFSRLREEMNVHQLDTLLISAENLINPHGFEKLFTKLANIFDIQIFAYVRRQDDYLISAWQQWYLKSYPDIDSFLTDAMGKDANWEEYLAPWEETFGTDSITVRRYIRSELIMGNVVADFFATNNLSLEGTQGLDSNVNLTMNEHIGTLANSINDIFSSIHDNEFYDSMAFVIGESAYKKTKGSQLLSLDQRMRILSHYENSNAVVLEKYFPSIEASLGLFPEPDESLVIPMKDTEYIQGQIDILARAVFGIAKKLLHEHLKNEQK